MFKFLVNLCGIALCLVSLSSCGSRIGKDFSDKQWSLVKVGLSRNQVEDAMGKPQRAERDKSGNVAYFYYFQKASAFGGDGKALSVFFDSRDFVEHVSRRELSSSSLVNLDQVKRLRKGMTKSQVRKVMRCDPNFVERNNHGNFVYAYHKVNVSFVSAITEDEVKVFFNSKGLVEDILGTKSGAPITY